MAPTAAAPTTATTSVATSLLTTASTAISTTTNSNPLPHLLAARLPNHTPDPDADPARSDAHMSEAARALKLRNLTIGWTLGIIGLCVIIGVTVFCVVGKRRCGFGRRERDFTGFDARVASGGVPRASEYDTRTEAEKRDERMIRAREEEEAERKRREEEGAA